MRTLQPMNWLTKRLGVTKYRAYQLTRSGIVPCVRIGRSVKVDPDVVEEWIRNGGQAHEGGWRRETNGPESVDC
jgi:excisionase family DNA binding protein